VSAALSFYADPTETVPLGEIELADVWVGIDEETGLGDPKAIFGRNTGNTKLREVTVGLDGDGGEAVQLAVDENGSPGLWAAPGEGIRVAEQLGPDEQFMFWSRAQFDFGAAEGEIDFEFVFSAYSVG
jgi:hypothetical protein